jgi:hypothetical protein
MVVLVQQQVLQILQQLMLVVEVVEQDLFHLEEVVEPVVVVEVVLVQEMQL